MTKIPTLFVREYPAPMPRKGPESAGALKLGGNRAYVIDEVTPGCEWVLAGEGVPTRKYDGSCMMFDGTNWWARREIKVGKDAPANFVAVETDETTGKTVGWEPVEQSGFAKFVAEAIAGEDFQVGTYELCGPKINGNPEKFDMHVLVPHDRAASVPDPLTRSYDSLRYLLTDNYPDEGIVWHHSDGRMAKLKVRDFPVPDEHSKSVTSRRVLDPLDCVACQYCGFDIGVKTIKCPHCDEDQLNDDGGVESYWDRVERIVTSVMNPWSKDNYESGKAPDDLDFPPPDCSVCDGELEYDDGWYCQKCGSSWNRDGRRGSFDFDVLADIAKEKVDG